MLGDLCVGESASDQLEDVELAFCEFAERGGCLSGRGGTCSANSRPARSLRRQTSSKPLAHSPKRGI